MMFFFFFSMMIVMLMGGIVFETITTGSPQEQQQEQSDEYELVDRDLRFSRDQLDYLLGGKSNTGGGGGGVSSNAVVGGPKGEPFKYRWPNGVIPFMFFKNRCEPYRRRIVRAMEFWMRHTCVTFKEQPYDQSRIESGGDYSTLLILCDVGCNPFRGGGCAATLGYQPIPGKKDQFKFCRNAVELAAAEDCLVFGSIVHELGHSLGLIHEHQRADRDLYLKVNTSMVVKEVAGQINPFRLNETDALETPPYDYGSIMNYKRWAKEVETKDGKKHIIMDPIDQRFKRTLGQIVYPSFLDILTVNKLYCQKTPDDPMKKGMCVNGGVLHPTSCDECLCPWGTGGPTCSDPQPSTGGTDCRGEILTAPAIGDGWAVLRAEVRPHQRTRPGGNTSSEYDNEGMMWPSIAACHWHIRAASVLSDKKARVALRFKKIMHQDQCDEFVTCFTNAVELKLGEPDFAASGIRYCCAEDIYAEDAAAGAEDEKGNVSSDSSKKKKKKKLLIHRSNGTMAILSLYAVDKPISVVVQYRTVLNETDAEIDDDGKEEEEEKVIDETVVSKKIKVFELLKLIGKARKDATAITVGIGKAVDALEAVTGALEAERGDKQIHENAKELITNYTKMMRDGPMRDLSDLKGRGPELVEEELDVCAGLLQRFENMSKFEMEQNVKNVTERLSRAESVAIDTEDKLQKIQLALLRNVHGLERGLYEDKQAGKFTPEIGDAFEAYKRTARELANYDLRTLLANAFSMKILIAELSRRFAGGNEVHKELLQQKQQMSLLHPSRYFQEMFIRKRR